MLIDTLISETAARKTRERIRGKIKYIIYTHGHADHVGGTRAFMDDHPEVIASTYLPDRLEKYKMLDRVPARSSAIQFNIPEPVRSRRAPVYPTRTFLGEMTFSLGGKTFELHTARAETDDACWVAAQAREGGQFGDLRAEIGDPEKILSRARALFDQGQAQLALQVLDVLIQAESENLEARRLRIELLEKLGSEDYCLMSRNAWVYFMERDREFLLSRGDG